MADTGLLGTGWEDPRTLASFQLAAGLLSPGSFGQGLGRGLAGYTAQMSADAENQIRKAQVQEMLAAAADRKQKMQDEAQQRAAYQQLVQSMPPLQPTGIVQGTGPTNPVAAPIDPRLEMADKLFRAGVMKPEAYMAARYPQVEPMTVAEGASVINKNDPTHPLFTAPAKPATAPSAIQEYQFAVAQGYKGTFQQFQVEQKRAGATSISLTTKVGDSLAAQTGPMLAASYSAAQGAQQAIVNSDNLIAAVDSGKVFTGPGSTFRLGAAQLGQVLGVGGKDAAEQIQNTRAAIQALAQSTVSARAQLKGQGQVSDFEGKLLMKAASGEVDNMTGPEIKQIAVINKRLANLQIQQHNELLGKYKANPELAPLANIFEPTGAPRVRVYDPQTGGFK